MRVSVIIPTLNEAGQIGACIASARQAGADEILVADGGSQDETCRVAEGAGAGVIQVRRGRARQMNAGAQQTSGETLLFLHADTRLPAGGIAAVTAILSDEQVVGGTFRLAFDRPHPILRLYGWFTRLGWVYLHYGDQAIFTRRSAFEALGGYADLPLMEDIDLLKRLRRHGGLARLPLAVTTSARRFKRRGIIRQELLNIALVGLYLLGVPPVRLKGLYPEEPRRMDKS